MRRFNLGRPPFARPDKPRSRLRLESLEDRANPVTAALNGTTLVITGSDFAHDVIAVRQTTNNIIQVFDAWVSTTVPVAEFFRSSVSGITVDGGAGDDLIDLHSIPGGRLTAL